MFYFWTLLAALAGLAGARYLVRLRRGLREEGSPIDDAAVRRIIERGTFHEEGKLDLDEAARAESEFWSETWDEPEEFPRT